MAFLVKFFGKYSVRRCSSLSIELLFVVSRGRVWKLISFVTVCR